jgi:hypothetical protein
MEAQWAESDLFAEWAETVEKTAWSQPLADKDGFFIRQWLLVLCNGWREACSLLRLLQILGHPGPQPGQRQGGDQPTQT